MKKIGAIFIDWRIDCWWLYKLSFFYADTYKGEKAYAQVPLEIPERKTSIKQSKKQPVSGLYSLKYALTFC